MGNYKGIIKVVRKFFCVLYSANIGGRETFLRLSLKGRKIQSF
jgi:hypothetical protein